MEKKTIGIIAVITTTLLCGLPGLAGLCFGALALLGTFMDGSGVPQEEVALVAGIALTIIGLSLILIAIPSAIGIWAWWTREPQIELDDILLPEDDF